MKAANKKLVIYKLPTGQMYKIRYDKGGKLPTSLSGKFNKIKYAEKAVEDYEAALTVPKREYRKSKVRKDDKNSTKPRAE